MAELCTKIGLAIFLIVFVGFWALAAVANCYWRDKVKKLFEKENIKKDSTLTLANGFIRESYQPDKDDLDSSKPPQDSGVPSKISKNS